MGTSFGLALLATALATGLRWHDVRVWSAFAAGGLVFFGTQLLARPVGTLVGAAGGGEVPVVAALVAFAELAKLTAALAVHQLYRMPAPEGSLPGVAVGAGFAAWSEATILRSAFQVAQMGLPGGVSVPSAVVASAARLLAGAGSTGWATRLAASGRLFAGLAVACAVQLWLDPGLRVLVHDPRWALAVTVGVGAGVFLSLWVPVRGEG